MSGEIEVWLKSGEYLPRPLRDFHDQKDVFRAIDETIKVRDSDSVKRPTWIEAQCYVIDVFLWYMARRGYTLQRTRKKAQFRELEHDVATCRQARNEAFDAMLHSHLSEPKP